MDFQMGKYKNLVRKLSSKFAKCDCFEREDFEQELWLALYKFIKEHSGEAENFPLIKTVLRNHLLMLLRSKSHVSFAFINSLIMRNVDLICDDVGLHELVEFKEVRVFINEWYQLQDETTRKYFLECLLDSDNRKVFFHRVKRRLGMKTSECYKIIESLRSFLKSKGVDENYVFEKIKN